MVVIVFRYICVCNQSSATQIVRWKQHCFQPFISFSFFRIIELLLSVNGDSLNTNGLKAAKAVAAGSSAVLSLSATIYLEPWQTLYLMIRSSGAGTVEVVNGSTFSVALIGTCIAMTFCYTFSVALMDR